MKDFDQEWSARRAVESRTFQVLGERFVMKAAVRPEVFSSYGSDEKEDDSSWDQLDGMFLSMVETDGDAEARYRVLRARVSDGLGVQDIRDILDWLVEQQTGRPPTSRSDSSGGLTRTGGRSTAVSPLRGSRAA